MAIGAHPDDIEIGMGGSIAKLSNNGYNIVMVDLSDGEPTPFGSHEKRMIESQNSAKTLNVKKRITLNMKNREIFDTVGNRKKLASVIREYKPKILFIPYADVGHPDHFEANKLCLASRFYAKLTKTDMPFEPFLPPKTYVYYTLHLRLHIKPTFIIDISSSFDKKIEAINCFASQFTENVKNHQAINNVETENSYWGKQIRKSYGEPFSSIEYLEVNDLNQLFYDKP